MFLDPEKLEVALAQTRPFQVRGVLERMRNPIDGVSTAIDPTRRFRPKAPRIGDKLSTPPEACDFCVGRTIPAVLHANPGVIDVPDPSAAAQRGRMWVEQHGPVTRDNFGALLEQFRFLDGVCHPLARTFPNVCPMPGLGASDVTDSFVTSMHPDYHDADLCECPEPVLAAMVDSWKALHVWSEAEGRAAVPYINGGRDRRSGQSAPHPHSQTTILRETPPLFRAMQQSKQEGRCAVCEMAALRHLHIAVPGIDGLRVMAHPAPEFSWGVLVFAPACHDDFLGVDSAEFSRAYVAVLGALSVVLNGIPPYNVVVRVGTGHFHAEIIVRNTTIKAGAEMAIREAFIDTSPRDVQTALSQAIERKSL